MYYAVSSARAYGKTCTMCTHDYAVYFFSIFWVIVAQSHSQCVLSNFQTKCYYIWGREKADILWSHTVVFGEPSSITKSMLYLFFIYANFRFFLVGVPLATDSVWVFLVRLYKYTKRQFHPISLTSFSFMVSGSF